MGATPSVSSFLFGTIATGEIHVPPQGRRHTPECGHLLPPLEKVCGRDGFLVADAARGAFGENNEAIDVREGEGPKEQPVHQAERRGVGAEPKR